jgi:hypothetical protein
MTEPESIRTLATVTLALDELGPQAIDRLAELVAERLIEQRAAGAEPLLSTGEAARRSGDRRAGDGRRGAATASSASLGSAAAAG